MSALAQICKSMSDIKREILELNSFKEIAQTYQEVAAMRMRKVKASVLRNREFLSGLTEVFSRVRVSYDEGLRELLDSNGIKKPEEQQEYIEKMNFEKKNGRDALVFVSSNTGLYGDIILDVFNYFAKHIDAESDIFIMGRLGRILFEQRFPGHPYKYYEVSDAFPELDKVSQIVRDFNPYEHILVFHGRFKDILEQVPHQTSISGEKLSLENREDLKRINCIFEPSVEEVFRFFESEIKLTLFDQSLYESSLSKFTSRMVSLDSAVDNVSDLLKKMSLRSSLASHKKFDKEKNTILASVFIGR